MSSQDESKSEIEDEKTQSKTDEFEEQMKDYDVGQKFPEFEGWEEIGFHRPLANELWEVFLELLNNSLYILVIVYLVPLVQPFPESGTYVNWAASLFATVYMIFDTGTNFNLNRFIAEYRTKDPRKMMEYVSFFVKYQMWTGLIQFTLLSWFTFEFIDTGNFTYLIWLILIEVSKQYPGMKNIFEEVLKGMQHFSYVQVSNWIQNKGVEMILNIFIILIGRFYGEANAEVGILMSIAIFSTFSKYIDDIIFMVIDAWYLNKIFKKYMGFSLKDSFNFKIGNDVYRNVVIFGIPGSIIPAITSFISTWLFFLQIGEIAGIATFQSLIGIGAGFTGVVGQIGTFYLETNVAESYMTDKKILSEFYVSFSLKWHYYFKILFAMSVLAVLPYFGVMLREVEGLEYYQAALFFLVPALIRRLLETMLDIPNKLMIACKKLNQIRVIDILGSILNPIDSFFWIMIVKIQNTGLWGVTFVLMFGNWIPRIIISLIKYIYVRKNLMKIKIYWMTTFVIPAICALPALIFANFWFYTGFPPMLDTMGFVLATVLLFPLYFVVLVFTYFPLTVLVGGWDDYQLYTFKKAVDLSGPSKFIFKHVYRLLVKCAIYARKKGYHGRFAIPHEEAHKEIVELMELKKKTKNELLNNE